jgi:hypothetical protein
MDAIRRVTSGVAAIVAAAIICGEAGAQSTAAATGATSGAATTGLGSGYSPTNGMGFGAMGLGAMGMGMGGMNMGGINMGVLPLAYALNPSASLSPTDAAALGMQAPQNNSMSGQLNSLLTNPMATPFLYAGSGMSGNQMAAMMVANQAQSLGFGSGQMSGVRPTLTGGAQPRKPGAAKPRGTASTPGGLAANYFHRYPTTAHQTTARYPQSYYSRQNRYFPQPTR